MKGRKAWTRGIIALLSGVVLFLLSAGEVRAFYIYGYCPPPPPGGGGETPPPGEEEPPPPPGGEGESPPGATPEPTSMVSALVGSGLALGYGWRRRRQKT